MRLYFYFIAAAFAAAFLFGTATQAQQPIAYKQKASALLFMENKGQVADTKGNSQPDILFTATSGGAKVYLTSGSIHYQFSKIVFPEGYDPQSKAPPTNPEQAADLLQQTKVSTHRFTVALQGANPHPVVAKEGQSNYTENYYLPQCPNGITGLHGYEKIIFKEVYPSIDWAVYSKGAFMEYDFLVHPGGNPAAIRLKIEDADAVSITPTGELLLQTGLGEVKEKAPVSYADGRIVPSHFKQNSDGTIGFAMEPQTGKELRIDPSIVWSTYYGGSNEEFSGGCATDNNGSMYLAGMTLSNADIAAGGFQNTIGGGVDAFLVKFNNAGARLWATYYGGNSLDQAVSCTVDNDNNVYMAGNTNSSTGIAATGFQNTIGGDGDAFLVKFSTTGTRLWATYYGGSSSEGTYACSTDNDGNVYLAGYTNSTNGIAANGFQNTITNASLNSDGFLVKFSSSGSRLWGTYYGGPGLDYAYACATDINNNIYLAGFTQSTTGIASGGFQNSVGGGDDCFLVKFSPTGSRLWGTYYGSTGAERAYAVATDEAANVYLTGITQSATGLAANGFQNTYGGNTDAFLAAFNGSGSRLWSTYYGGENGDNGYACVSDRNSHIYLVGATSSATGIAANGFQNSLNANGDGYVVKFNIDGSRVWGSYFGGNSGSDGLHYAAADNLGNLFVAGSTASNTGIAINGFQNTYAGGGDVYLGKINPAMEILPITLTSINAWQQAATIVVQWKVQQESGVKVYEVERSFDGITFSKAGKKVADGSNSYNWTDAQPQAGANYYRLRIVDVDGKITYSPVVKVSISTGKQGYEIYPNPVTGTAIHLSFINQPAGIYTIRLFSAASQLILTQQVLHQQGSSAEIIYLSNALSKGNYLMEITAPDGKKQIMKLMH